MSVSDKISRLNTAKTNIANAITAKGGTVQSGDGFEDFAAEITAIPSGGVTPSGTVYCYENNTSYDVTNYAAAEISVPIPQPMPQEILNITPTEQEQDIYPSVGYTIGEVTVGAIQTETGSFTQNGTYTPTSGKYYNEVSVNVSAPTPEPPLTEEINVIPTESSQEIFPSAEHYISKVNVDAVSSNYVGSNIPRRDSADLSVSGTTVSVPSGYYSGSASKSVATAEQATPSVSVNSSTGVVTATATQTAGYVSAGSKSGTLNLSTQAAVTITPSSSSQTAVAAGKYTTGAITVAAVPTETKTATENGTVTPTSGKYLSSVDVNVPIKTEISGSATENGTYTPPSGQVYSSFNVNVEGVPLPATITAGETPVLISDMKGGESSKTSFSALIGEDGTSPMSIAISQAGTYRFRWGGVRTGSSSTCYFRLYKNNTAAGSQINLEGKYDVYTADLACSAGDIITLYGKSSSTSITLYAFHFIACIDWDNTF